jgi:hypothetical protein
MIKNDRQLGTPFGLFSNTKANIEALTGLTGGETAYATDTGEDGVYDAVAEEWVWGRSGGGGGGGTPAGGDGEIQFNDDGDFGASPYLKFDNDGNLILGTRDAAIATIDEDGINLVSGTQYLVNGAQHTHDGEDVNIDASGFSGNLDSSVTDVQLLANAVDALTVGGGSSDGWIEDTNTWTFKNRTQAYTNDPVAGTGIVLNMTNTADFVIGSDVTVSSSAGSEDTIITNVVANTSITVNQLTLNHTTTSPLVTLKDCFTINADVTSYIRKGTFLKFTQSTVKYGVVYTSVFNSGLTTIVLIPNTDYPLTNTAISSTYYSNITYPDGWPVWFNYDPEPLGWSTLPSANIVYEYMTIGTLMTISINQPSSSGGIVSNATTMKFSTPCLTVSSTVVAMGQAMNNGSLLTGATKARTGQLGLDRVIDCYTDMANGAWTNTGAKRVIFIMPFVKF